MTSLQTDQELPNISNEELAATRTDLALERSGLADERTLMAWIRTSLAMISFGFTIGKLGDALKSTTINLVLGRTTDVLGVAYFLVAVGTVALVLAAIQFKVESVTLVRRGLKRRPSLALAVAVLLSILGLFVFLDLITRF